MKVSVYKDVEGVSMVLVEPSLGKGKPPVMLQGITPENIKDKVLATVEEMRRPKASPPGGQG